MALCEPVRSKPPQASLRLDPREFSSVQCEHRLHLMQGVSRPRRDLIVTDYRIIMSRMSKSI